MHASLKIGGLTAGLYRPTGETRSLVNSVTSQQRYFTMAQMWQNYGWNTDIPYPQPSYTRPYSYSWNVYLTRTRPAAASTGRGRVSPLLRVIAIYTRRPLEQDKTWFANIAAQWYIYTPNTPNNPRFGTTPQLSVLHDQILHKSWKFCMKFAIIFDSQENL